LPFWPGRNGFTARSVFEPGNVAPALLLLTAGGTVTFWFSPLIHWWSRRYEYQADAFAARVMSGTQR